MTGLWASIGVTHSFSIDPFLRALASSRDNVKELLASKPKQNLVDRTTNV